MRRVVITGMGIVSCLGYRLEEVTKALFAGNPGITFVEEYARRGLRSCVAGIPRFDDKIRIERRLRRYMSDTALYAYHATKSAVADAGLPRETITSPRTGLIVGSGTGSPLEIVEVIEIYKSQGAAKMPPYEIPRIMGSTTSANLVSAFGIHGTSYSLTSACATSAHTIGHGAELIQSGKQDCVIVGGAEEVSWISTLLFDAMHALSTGFNDRPLEASRPYDKQRDGFVISGGAGILILEELDSAIARGAHIYGELLGYAAVSDGGDMVTPDPDGAARAMRLALEQAGVEVDYINTHATSTRIGDMTELEAIRQVFGNCIPLLSSTKGLTGHSIAAAGAHEAIYCLLMLQHDFVAGCANLDEPDEATDGLPLVVTSRHTSLDTIMSNSFGFGGTNASLVFRRWSPATQ
jgi:3-oxoacyl-[acyl-carrier-protein] synthase-1